ncbi:MAG: triphosphoribosyl-dephospho-CoA synthase [Firmicutes bacterium]|nr:triphosphoribosyl-dephospho-CoA synthase [Bacillota bacterium]
MNNQFDEILLAREARNNNIKNHLIDSNVVVSIKANIPGENKQISIAYFLVHLFSKAIHFSNVVFQNKFDGLDGPYFLYVLSNATGKEIKENMIAIEDTHELGRFIDIDVYQYNKIFKRESFRNCFLCEQNPVICRRLKKHSKNDIFNKIQDEVKRYIYVKIENLIDYSLLSELELSPKFGLVTPTSNGSHTDMEYSLLRNSIKIVKPFLLEMFLVGSRNLPLDQTFKIIREIGKIAEGKMYKFTQGINTYKGIIFNLGLIITACGYGLFGHYPYIAIFDIVKIMAKDLTDEIEVISGERNMIDHPNFEFTGARGEAERGYLTIQEVLPMLIDDLRETRILALIRIIQLSEDSICLKRCKTFENYLTVKRMFEGIRNFDEDLFINITSKCIEKNVSFGGSADLLVASIFLTKIKDLFDY